MSPVHIPQGLHEVVHPGRGHLRSARRGSADAHAALARRHDLLLVEGTGHAGVGSVVGLSNAIVARHAQGARRIVVRGGSRPTDRRDRSQSRAVRAAWCRGGRRDRQQGRRRGCIRHSPASCATAWPSMASSSWARCRTGRSSRTPRSRCSWSSSRARCCHPGDDLDRVIEHVAIGAMQPRHLIERVGPGSLLIVPGDRSDRDPRDRRRRIGRRATGCRASGAASFRGAARYGAAASTTRPARSLPASS